MTAAFDIEAVAVASDRLVAAEGGDKNENEEEHNG